MIGIGASLGHLEGRGEVRGPDGELKAVIILTAQCTPEQAARAAQIMDQPLEVTSNGSDSSHGNP